MSVRRYAALVRWLPTDAALWRSMGNDWSTAHELQAITVEVLDSLRRMYLQTHVKKGTNLPPPIEIPRPWTKSRKAARRSGTTLGEMLSMMKVPVSVRGGDS